MSALKSNTTDIAALWMQTGRLMRDRMFKIAGSKNIHPIQMLALFMISEHPSLTMKELADLMGVTSPSATSLVDRLVKMKWVVRIADPKNRKLVRLKIAPLGKNTLTAIMRKQAQAMKEILSHLQAGDQRDFARILFNLHSALLHDTQR